MFIFLVWAICRASSKTYTHEEWEEQCKRDFQKYGPVPEDEDIFPKS